MSSDPGVLHPPELGYIQTGGEVYIFFHQKLLVVPQIAYFPVAFILNSSTQIEVRRKKTITSRTSVCFLSSCKTDKNKIPYCPQMPSEMGGKKNWESQVGPSR